MTGGRAGAPVYRVLFHIRHFGVGGIENALLGWLRALDRRHFELGVCVSLPTRDLETVFRQRIPDDVALHCLTPPRHWLSRLHQKRRDEVLGLAGRAMLGVGMSTVGRRRMRRGLAGLAANYDVVIDFDLTLRKLAKSVGRPLIGVRHFGLWSTRTAKAVRVGRDYRHYDCLVVLNEAMRAQARILYGESLRRVEVIPNAFDLDAIRRAAHETPPELPRGPYVVCVARLDIPTKGLDTLLRAWRIACDTHAAALASHKLVLVGEGSDRERLIEQVRELGLQEQVLFAGLQVNPYPWIRQARLLVLGSRTEGSPNVLIEALALDTMIVATDCPVGPREILDDGAAGLLVPVDDAEALAAAMWRALTDEELRRSCRDHACERADDYGLDAANRRMLALVRQLEISARG